MTQAPLSLLQNTFGINKIINGGMEVAQRGTSFVNPTSGAYTLDRWFWASNGVTSAITISQQSDSPNSRYANSLRTLVTTADASIAAGDVALISQNIEGYNIRDLIGKTFHISFWVRSAKTGVHCVALRNATADRSFIAEYTVNAVNTWEYKTVRIAGGLTSVGTWDYTTGAGVQVNFALAGGSTWQSTAGTWNSNGAVCTSNQVNVLDAINNIFAITGVNLTIGNSPLEYEPRFLDHERALCRRYYQKFVTVVGTLSTATIFPIWMRITPVITGGGAGFVSPNTNADILVCGQTTSANQTLSLNAEL